MSQVYITQKELLGRWNITHPTLMKLERRGIVKRLDFGRANYSLKDIETIERTSDIANPYIASIQTKTMTWHIEGNATENTITIPLGEAVTLPNERIISGGYAVILHGNRITISKI